MIRTKKTVRHLGFMMSSNLFNMLAALASMFFYTRVLSTEEMALIPISAILSSAVYTVSDLGLGLYVQRRLPEISEKDPLKAGGLSRTYFFVTTIGGIVCCLVLAATSGIVAQMLLKNRELSWQIILLIPSIVVSSSWTCLAQILMGKGMFERLSIFSVIAQVIHPISVILMYLWSGVAGMILGLALGRGIVCLLIALSIRRDCFGCVPIKHSWQFIKDSWPFYAEGYINYPVSFADQWIVGIFLTPVDLAIYYIPRTMYDKLLALSNAFGNVMITIMSKMRASGLETAKHGFNSVRRLCILLYTPMCAVLLSASFFLVDLLAGPKYHAGVVPFAILVILFWVGGLIYAYSLGVMTMAPPRQRLYVVLVQSAALLVSMPVLSWALQLNGVVISRVLSRLTGGFTSGHFLSRIFPTSIDLHAVKIVALPSLLLLIVSGSPQLFYYNRLVVPLYLTLGISVYAWLFMHNISDEDMQVLEELLPDRFSWLLLRVRNWCGKSAKPFKPLA